jgi:hypothetical protein
MASSSTNKQPLLVDRPFFEAITVGNLPCLTVANDLNAPSPTGLVQLMAAGEDGSIVDGIWMTALQTGLDAIRALLFVSTAPVASLITPENTKYFAGAAVSSATVGFRVNFELPPMLCPVPNLAGPAATMATYPTEFNLKNTGVLLPAGKYIYGGVTAAFTTPSATARVNILAQGGHY